MNIQQGDEIIVPSYTFVSSANAFVLRGGVPIFVDIRPDTLNINEFLIEQAISPKTKAIVVVHYAGVACEMDSILKIAKENNYIPFVDMQEYPSIYNESSNPRLYFIIFILLTPLVKRSYYTLLIH